MSIYTINTLFADAKMICEKQEEITIYGWIRTNRVSGKIGFIQAYDGSNLNGIQIVYKNETTKNFDSASSAKISSSLNATGILKFNERSNTYEILATEINITKQANEDYPLQKKQHTMEFLRDVAHLRPRTKTMQAIMMVRSKLAFAIHSFFQKNGFLWVSSPIITSNDCEGAGESFFIQQDNTNPFFSPQARLTVSGQLNAEAYAQSFGRVYTFCPAFRADWSHTNRHLAEFWMVEPEIAFMNLEQLISFIEIFIKSVVIDVMENCKDSFEFFTNSNPKLKERLNTLTKKEFIKIPYEKAIDLLKTAIISGHKFEDNNIFFGKDLASEHERYICEQIYNSPVFLYNYPKEIKAFYMKQNNDNKTVAACDLLVPGVGEIAGGSQREDDYEKLILRSKELNMDIESIQWYFDLRKYGYQSSSGFGLGFERLIMYILGIENIKDVIPFPRFQGVLKF